MLSVIVSAYAVSPNWGSEPGMGWNWVKSLASHCRVHVITEGQWREEIEKALSTLPCAENLVFHYLPVDGVIREMCWNQGDWRFYWYYRKWQKRALAKAREIMGQESIDIIHQLNMIGFREPGFLWKIKNVPFVWGPIGGMDNIPLAYLKGTDLRTRTFVVVKNVVNWLQCRVSPRVRKAIFRADVLLAAVDGVSIRIKQIYGKASVLMNETGCDIEKATITAKDSLEYDSATFDILWAGRFIFTKQLGLALRTVAQLKGKANVKLHICGGGSQKEELQYKSLAEELGISGMLVWHGIVSHEEVLNRMKSSQLFFLSSIMEGTPHVVLEALQCCLPVLCFDSCGMGAIVNESVGDKIGYSNPDDSIMKFAEKIEYYIHHRDELERKSSNCMIRQRELSWESKAGKIVDLYADVLKLYR